MLRYRGHKHTNDLNRKYIDAYTRLLLPVLLSIQVGLGYHVWPTFQICGRLDKLRSLSCKNHMRTNRQIDTHRETFIRWSDFTLFCLIHALRWRDQKCNGGEKHVRIITACTVVQAVVHRVSKNNCTNLFLSERRQISTNFDNFWHKDGKEATIMWNALIFHLT